MLLLAAALLFTPHYEVTRAPEAAAVLLATDAKGYAYVASQSPVTGAASITKLDPDGNLVYEISPMPNQGVISAGIPDDAGNVYLALSVSPPGGGLVQGYVAKLAPSGKVLFNYPFPALYANALAVGLDGSIYLTGWGGLQTTPGAWVSATSFENIFVVRLSSAGQVVYATYLDNSHMAPANNNSSGTAIAVDAAGNAYIGGQTFDASFPTTPGAYLTQCCTAPNTAAAFLMKLNPKGTAPVYSTFLPGTTPTSIVLDAAGGADLTIETWFTPAAITTAQVSAGGDQLNGLITTDLSMLLPGGFGPGGGTAAADGQGNILVTGPSAPAGFAVTGGGCVCGANLVAIVRAVDGSVLYATQLPNGAGGAGVASDGSGGFIVMGAANWQTRPLVMLTRFSPVTTAAPVILGLANAGESVVGEGLAPGEIIGIYGMDLGPGTAVAGGFTNGSLPLELGGTEVLINGIRAPLLRAGSGQVNAIVPFELSRSLTATVQVIANGSPTNIARLPVLTAEPAILAGPSGLALALNQDGSINSQQNPAQLGTVVAIFLNGAGLQTPAPADGTLAQRGPLAAATVAVQAPVPDSYGLPYWQDTAVLYAGAAPGEVAGLMQVNFRLPSVQAPFQNGQMTIVAVVGGLSGTAYIWAP